LRLINQQSSRGSGPCYLSTDRAGKYVFVANYNSGTVAVLPVDGHQGSLKTFSGFDQHTSLSEKSGSKKSPHAHCILLDKTEQNALSADLGTDQIYSYRFSAIDGSLLRTTIANAAKRGDGPRHLIFNANQKFVYVMNELTSTITTYNYFPVMQPVQTVSTLPNGFTSYNTGAELLLHPISEKYLYASNRGHNSIAVFSVDNNIGHLTLIQHMSVQGQTPRNFIITPDGKHLIVANQDSNNLVVFTIDQTTGKLTATGSTAQVSRPTCVKYLVQ
jgi:6-phosphogluconolactonase